MPAFPFYEQLDAMDCGPTCLRMIARYYGKHFTLQTLREKSYLTREGVSLLGIAEAAESIGFQTMGVSITWEKLLREAPLPVIVHWKQNHFIVVYKIRRNKVYVSDPGFGQTTYTKEEFLKGWISTRKDGEPKGSALLLQPTPDFFNQEDEPLNKKGFRFLLRYLSPYKRYVFHLFLGLFLGSIIQLILPFLFQSIVDFGITNQDRSFIFLILTFQFVLILTVTGIDLLRRWILLHLSTRVNISLISDFLFKLMKLPIGFFDTKLTGDILQRIGDHRRIEAFLTTSSLTVLFSMVNLVIFGIILGIYSLKILLIFIVASILYFIWVSVFMKKRRSLDHKKFSRLAEEQSKMIQIIHGIRELKLNNAERKKRWEWQNIQAGLFRLNIKSMQFNQYQEAGGIFINESKNILINVVAALAVLNGNMTLGMLIAVSYILGQLNGPIEQMISFMRRAQEAKISLERLGEIHETKDETQKDTGISLVPAGADIRIKDLTFSYQGPYSRNVLQDINVEFQKNSITAIVGMSGSGKTTLVKLLLGFYPPSGGEIRIGDQNIVHMQTDLWRNQCGVVMQDGYIFSDTIASNIALGRDDVDSERLLYAARMACIDDFIDELPLGYNSKIGQEGLTLSGGEYQRILIARAVYKDPAFFFMDEGTSALDANNERRIMKNLEEVFREKTVIIVAHRLSTVRNAHNIVVMDNGRIVEQGNHNILTMKKGYYYNLIRNQLEMGS
ncbi:MAG: peptidase domain-containing ABC transporter [Bacteroidales bacterium]|nr:peptidase domain-containing ABC transporter [Bacteroidales bacterium]MBN2698956.1 peptidase domain-containing ABC transporter [Bacteroidales bacterium]